MQILDKLDKDAPIICADCLSVEIKGNHLFCSERNRIIYNSKPDWCPHPTWIPNYQQLSLFKRG